MPDAIVALGDAKRLVGSLRFESDGRRQHSQFEYAIAWLEAADRFALSPGLPLRYGGHFAAARGERRAALPGCFQDAAPDSWGRALMTRALGGDLTEFDYLVRSDDHTRHGALRFLDADLRPLSRLSPPVPRLIELDRLRRLAHRFEKNPGRTGPEILELAGVAGSLGGARPKASVEHEGQLWLAKFTSADDRRAIERVEVATLRLAAHCGLRVPEARLELSDSDSPVALFRRFDRRGPVRIPYISARTAMDHGGSEPGYYTDIADVIRRISARPLDDLAELWRRMVFTILVSNTDDHLKNHGFIYVGNDRWRLAPAFDINPSPTRQRVLQTGLMEGEAFDASLDLALTAAACFELEADDARRVAARMADRVRRHWKRMLKSEGASPSDLRDYAPAFEHAEMDKALQLGN